MKNIFIWVVNSVRDFSQSAAQGVILRAAYDLKISSTNSNHILLISNEVPERLNGLIETNQENIQKKLAYWTDKVGISVPAKSIFSSIIAIPKLESYHGSLEKIFSNVPVSILKTELVALFASSYPSEKVLSWFNEKNIPTVLFNTAKPKFLDARYDVISINGISENYSLKAPNNRIQYIIPQRLPLPFGYNLKDRNKKIKNHFNIMTSGEKIIKQLTTRDIELILKILNRAPQVKWHVIGDNAPEDWVRLIRESQAPYYAALLREMTASGRISLSDRREDIFEFFAAEANCYFNGLDRVGGGTTCSACAVLGVPAVFSKNSDATIGLGAQNTFYDDDSAEIILSKLIHDPDFYQVMATRQNENLAAYNATWYNNLISVLEKF